MEAFLLARYGCAQAMAAHLAAYALAGGYRLVTTDAAFKQFRGLDPGKSTTRPGGSSIERQRT